LFKEQFGFCLWRWGLVGLYNGFKTATATGTTAKKQRPKRKRNRKLTLHLPEYPVSEEELEMREIDRIRLCVRGEKMNNVCIYTYEQHF